MSLTCPKCQQRQPAGEICIHCGLVFHKYRLQPIGRPVPMEQRPSPEAEPAVQPDGLGWPGFFDLLALLLIWNAAVLLRQLVPATTEVFGNLSLNFWEWSNHFYDLLNTGGALAASFALLLRKHWAHPVLILCLALSLGEGVILLARQWPDAGIEEEKRLLFNLVGCLLYALFLARLCSSRGRTACAGSLRSPLNRVLPALAVAVILAVLVPWGPASATRYRITGKMVSTSPVETREGDQRVVRREERYFVSLRVAGDISQHMIEVSPTYYRSVQIGDTVRIDDVVREEARF